MRATADRCARGQGRSDLRGKWHPQDIPNCPPGPTTLAYLGWLHGRIWEIGPKSNMLDLSPICLATVRAVLGLGHAQGNHHFPRLELLTIRLGKG
jgi:hypothetical protein